MSVTWSGMQRDLLALFDTDPPANTRTVCPNCVGDRPGGWITEEQPRRVCGGCHLGYWKPAQEIAMEFLSASGWDHHKDRLAVYLARQGPATLRKAHALALQWIEHGLQVNDHVTLRLGEALKAAVFWGYVSLKGAHPEKNEIEAWLQAVV